MDVNTSTYIDEMDQNKSPSSHFIVRPQEKQITLWITIAFMKGINWSHIKYSFNNEESVKIPKSNQKTYI